MRHVGASLSLGLVLLFLAPAPSAAAADSVTKWSQVADVYGDGFANWYTQVIMHQAMHDALNAILPTFERWNAPAKDEPSASGASPGAAIAGAAAQVLRMLHPSRQEDTERILHQILDGYSDDTALRAGVKLGEAIGRVAVERRDGDGSLDIRPFVGSAEPGRWARTPQKYATSNTSSTLPFLFGDNQVLLAPPPPALDSDGYRRGLAEVRRLGAKDSRERTDEQTRAAIFWAYQSSERGYLHLAIRLLSEPPTARGAHDTARILSQLATALADSAILSWREKEHFSYWRPVTAIRAGSAGVEADPNWMPVLETPPFPEYPSGHAAHCYTASTLLDTIFGAEVKEITYVSLQGSNATDLESLTFGMGQHNQMGESAGRFERQFPSLDAAAEECAESRIWAGAHFRAGNDEARRLGVRIAERAAVAVPPVK